MSAIRSLRADVIFYLAGTGVYAASQWMLVIIYAQVHGPEGVGLFAIATAISAPIVVLSQMSMRQVLIADVGRRFGFGDYVKARWVLSVAATGAIVLGAIALDYRDTALLTITAFGVGRAFESISDIFYARCQAHAGLRRVSCYTAVRGAITLAAAGGTMLATKDMLLSAIAFAVASMICQMMVRAIERQLIVDEPASSRQPLLSSALLLHAAPLAISQFLISLTAYSPRLILQHFGGDRLAGQAGAVEYFLSLGLLGVAALGQAASAPLAQAFDRGDRRGFIGLVTTTAATAAALGVGMALTAQIVGREVILGLYGPSFSDAAAAVSIIIAGGSFSYVASVLGYAVSATGRYDELVGWAALVLAVTLVGSYLAIGQFSLQGLGLSLAVSGILNILVHIHLLRRAFSRMPTSPSDQTLEPGVPHG
jgi:O-antigen/teichoic acid export membrane protein